MKTWNIPVAVAQKFAANEYISACTATINCNLNMNEYAVYWIPYDEPVVVNGKLYNELPYTTCGATHDVALDGQLSQVTIKRAGKVVNGAKVNVDLVSAITGNCITKTVNSWICTAQHPQMASRATSPKLIIPHILIRYPLLWST